MRAKGRSGADSLFHLTEMGARTRRSNYIGSVALFLIPVLITIILQSLIYVVFMLRATRSDYMNTSSYRAHA